MLLSITLIFPGTFGLGPRRCSCRTIHTRASSSPARFPFPPNDLSVSETMSVSFSSEKYCTNRPSTPPRQYDWNLWSEFRWIRRCVAYYRTIGSRYSYSLLRVTFNKRVIKGMDDKRRIWKHLDFNPRQIYTNFPFLILTWIRIRIHIWEKWI